MAGKLVLGRQVEPGASHGDGRDPRRDRWSALPVAIPRVARSERPREVRKRLSSSLRRAVEIGRNQSIHGCGKLPEDRPPNCHDNESASALGHAKFAGVYGILRVDIAKFRHSAE